VQGCSYSWFFIELFGTYQRLLLYDLHPYTFNSWFFIINKLWFVSNNYGYLIQVTTGSDYFQLDFSFLGLYSILIIGFIILIFQVHISWYQSLVLKSSFFYLSLNFPCHCFLLISRIYFFVLVYQFLNCGSY